MQNKHSFAIVSDIDGVIRLGRNYDIGSSSETVQAIQSQELPFYLLTNAGSITESQETQIINQKLETDLRIEQVMLCHTPLSSQDMVQKYKDKIILTAAPNEVSCSAIALEYGYNKHITLTEFACIYAFPTYNNFSEYLIKDSPKFYKYQYHEVTGEKFPDWKDQLHHAIKEYQVKCLERFGLFNSHEEDDEQFVKVINQFQEDLQVSAIMIWSQELDLGMARQVFCDLIASKNGKVFEKNNVRQTEKNADGKVVNVIDPQYVQIYFTNSDLVYPATMWKNNCTSNQLMGAGAFENALKTIYIAVYGYEPEFQNFGKPNLQHFQFVENKIKNEHGDSIKTIYMIGDNLRSDILGANTINKNSEVKWVSIAVKTGLYKSEQDVDNFVAQFGIEKELLTPQVVVDDFKEAIGYIKDKQQSSGDD